MLHAGTERRVTVVGMRLINCTDRPVAVLVEGRLALLEEGPAPMTVSTPVAGDPCETIELEGPGITGNVTVAVYDEIRSGALIGPDPEPGVLYLVSPATLARCGEREDFVTPALFATAHPEDLVEDAPAVLASQSPFFRVLASVTRAYTPHLFTMTELAATELPSGHELSASESGVPVDLYS